MKRVFYFLLLQMIPALPVSAQGWSTPVLISDMPGINNNQDMCIDRNDTRHVVWSHNVNGGYWIIMYSKSTTGGSTWTMPDTIVNIPGAWLYEPHIVSDTLNNLYVSFDSISQEGSFGQVYLITSTNEQWSNPEHISNQAELAMHHLLAIDNKNRLYIFWQGYFNLNYKFIYKYFENGLWSDQMTPFVDSNYYSIRSVKPDKLNNLHCTGLFKYFGEGGSRRRVFYSKYEHSSNSWQPVEVINDYNSDQGCDLACDSLSLPNLTWGQYTNTTLPYEFATNYKKQNLWGWGNSDTISTDRENNQKIQIDKYNNIHLLNCYVLPDNNTLTTLNYYTFSENGWNKEILDQNGSIIFFDMEATNETLDIVYGKMIDRPGPDTVKSYHLKKSIIVDLPQAVNQKQPLGIYPNPCSQNLTITMNIFPHPVISLKVFTIDGKLVKTFFENRIPVNNEDISWDLTDNNFRLIEPGNYILVLQSETFIHVIRFVKI